MSRSSASPKIRRALRLTVVGVIAAVAATTGMAIAQAASSSGPDGQGAQREAAVPDQTTPHAAAESPCALPEVVAALQRGDDDAVVAAIGGGAAVRAAVVSGQASCIDLSDPARVWMVVDKARPYVPQDFEPADLVRVNGIRVFNSGILRTDSGAALAELVAGARDAGVGELAITSGYRSYEDQRGGYASRVSELGRAAAEQVIARPGYSEHQSGLAADLVACGRGGCGSIDELGSTPQGQWLAENAWRYGFIVRYEEGRTAVTGYAAEPWHVRYIGVALAQAYHDGGFRTLEEFWGLPAAPDYVD